MAHHHHPHRLSCQGDRLSTARYCAPPLTTHPHPRSSYPHNPPTLSLHPHTHATPLHAPSAPSRHLRWPPITTPPTQIPCDRVPCTYRWTEDMDTMWPGLVATLPVVGGIAWFLIPRIVRCWRVRHLWNNPALFQPSHRPGIPIPVGSPGTEPTSPVVLLPPTANVGSFPFPDPYPTPTNTIRRISTVPTLNDA